MRLLAVFGVVAAIAAAPALAQDYSKFVASAKHELTSEFKDPDAALFRGAAVYQQAGGKDLYLCGDVNAKNSFGAYIGYAPFFARPGHAAIKEGKDDSLFDALKIGACHKRLATVK